MKSITYVKLAFGRPAATKDKPKIGLPHHRTSGRAAFNACERIDDLNRGARVLA
jgi:hypothetical protein